LTLEKQKKLAILQLCNVLSTTPINIKKVNQPLTRRDVMNHIER